MQLIKLGLALTVILFASGCATITRGTTEAFVIESQPPGGEARLSTGETCKTPCTLEKKRKHNFTIDLEKEGYEPVSVAVVSQVAGAGAAGMAGNVVFGGLIGAGVDAGTGATKELRPNPVQVTLAPLAAAADTTAGGAVAMKENEVGDGEEPLVIEKRY